MMESRQELLVSWIKQIFPKSEAQLNFALVSGDASFRKYYRVSVEQQNFIAVDAPPSREDSKKFVRICNLLRRASVKAPKVFSYNYEAGFILLEDFGDDTYLKILENLRNQNDFNKINYLYKSAINALLNIQANVDKEALDSYSREKLNQEMSLFEDWFCLNYLELDLDDRSRNIISEARFFLENAALDQLQVPVHRDYHSRNLMVLDQEFFSESMEPGVIDFQDAVVGPYTYDLVSLLRDAYIFWEKKQVEQWALYYFKNALSLRVIEKVDQAQFYRDFDLMGLQRQMKVIGIFARLAIRDNKPDYLADIPLVIRYFLEVGQRYKELKPFIHWFKKTVIPVVGTKIDLN